MDYIDSIPFPEFTAKDLREIVGLSYRQLNDWDEKGLVAAERGTPRGWRKFTCRQVFTLGICAEVNSRLGVPPHKLTRLQLWLDETGTDHFVQAAKLMNMHGGAVFLVTDLDTVFIVETDVRLAWLMRPGVFAESNWPAGLVFLRLNELVNRLLEVADSSHRFQGNRRGYEIDSRRRLVGSGPGLAPQEKKILDLIRSGRLCRIEVQRAGRNVRRRFGEEELQPEDVEMITSLIEDQAFQTLKVVRHDGKTTRLTRRRPIKAGDK